MKERAGKKKVVLELGGNAGVIVDKSADLDWAVKRCLVGAFSYAGQVCISVQRMVVHEDVWDAFMDRFVAGARALRLGDPLDPATDLGPMVDATAAGRTQRWVDEAVAMGGKLLLGGQADGTSFPPTILTDVPLAAQVCSNGPSLPGSSRSSASLARLLRSSMTRCSGSRPGCSPTTWPVPGRRSPSSKSAG
jgi:glyceraldehyde-3-phosphate dehydrogenase (NADP+)